MADIPKSSAKHPAAGDRDIDRELRRAVDKGPGSSGPKAASAQPAGSPLAPGDEAPPDTPGTGEDICPRCNGSGELKSSPCPHCQGTGRVVRAIGGA